MEIFGFWSLFGKDSIYPRLKKKNLPNFFSFTFGVCFNQEIFIFAHWWVDSFFSPNGKLTIPYTICQKGYLFLTVLKYHVCHMLNCHISVTISGFSILFHWSLCEPVQIPPCCDYYSLTVGFWGLVRQIPPYNYSFSLLGVGRYSSWWLSDSTILVIKKTQNLQGNLKRTETSVSDLSI